MTMLALSSRVLFKSNNSRRCKSSLGLTSFTHFSTSSKHHAEGVSCRQLVMNEYGDPDKVLKMQTSVLAAMKPGDVSM